MLPTNNPFSSSALANAVHQTLGDAIATIPPGKRGALLSRIVINPDGSKDVGLSLAAHINGNWEMALGGTWDGNTTHNPSASFAVEGSW